MNLHCKANIKQFVIEPAIAPKAILGLCICRICHIYATLCHLGHTISLFMDTNQHITLNVDYPFDAICLYVLASQVLTSFRAHTHLFLSKVQTWFRSQIMCYEGSQRNLTVPEGRQHTSDKKY